jgi:magnesium transporter
MTLSLDRALRRSRPADAAELLDPLAPEEAVDRALALTDRGLVELLDQAEFRHAGPLACALVEAGRAAVLSEVAEDRLADILADLDDEARAAAVAALPETVRGSVGRLMRYPAGTAGSLMTTEFVAVPQDWTVAATLDHVRRMERSRETIYAIYVLDAAGRLAAALSLRRLIAADPASPILAVGSGHAPVTVAPLDDREDVARLIRRYDLLAVPVVDADGRIDGIVTVDDVVDALMEEATEDIQRFGGTGHMERRYLDTGFLAMMRKRGVWLAVLFLGEMLTATAMQHFEGELEKAVVLAMFIPLIMSSGGNSGSQATSLLIRGLALGDVRLGDWWRVALREVPTGLALGLILGAIGLARILLWQGLGLYDYGPHVLLIGLTVAGALVGIVAFGSLVGAMLPFLLQRVGLDPASASAPLVATLIDVSGLVIYFGVASLVLSGTLL